MSCENRRIKIMLSGKEIKEIKLSNNDADVIVTKDGDFNGFVQELMTSLDIKQEEHEK